MLSKNKENRVDIQPTEIVRKRGRPRKQPFVSEKETNTFNSNEAFLVQLPEGGCLEEKTVLSTDGQPQEGMFSTVVRKRGRPRKQKPVFYTVTDSFNKLCAIQEQALAIEPKPDFTAALKSEELKGKLFALYSEKKEKEKDAFLPRVLVEFISHKEEAPQDTLEVDYERREDAINETSYSEDTGGI